MKTLLRIDASARIESSHSRKLANNFQKKWMKENSSGEVIVRDLAEHPIP